MVLLLQGELDGDEEGLSSQLSIKIHRDRNILELTISPTGSGQLRCDDRI